VALLTGIIIVTLLVTVANAPPFGDPDNPTNNEVYTRYVEKGTEETGATNTVAGMILDYRAFDTLGESIVLFTAVIFVIMLIRTAVDSDRARPARAASGETQPLILKVIVMLAGPFVMVYGAYIVFNGHLSPGGGFSGGAILGAGLCLYAAAFGAEKVRTMFTFKTYTLLSSTALLFYALSKGYAFYMGASGLPSGIPLGTPGNILSAGLILPLNICVGIVVACTVYGLFALFSEGEV
jgi:multicomponent Na+:H+ antiporter subunit B